MDSQGYDATGNVDPRRVVEMFPGRDGKHRVAKVLTACCISVRP